MDNLTRDNGRLDVAHIAESLYAEQAEEDRGDDIYTRNPDARKLFMKGVHATLTCLDAWNRVGVSPETLSNLMCELHKQSAA